MEKIEIVNKGFNYGQDGPGNRLVYHLLGCNMRCPWCANPEAMDIGGGMMKQPDGTQRQRHSTVEVDALVAEALSARGILIDGGGVTFTGGEPTLQHEPLLQALGKLRAAGLHTAIETNGTSKHFVQFLPRLSLLIMDFKHWDDGIHKQYTGISNADVIANMRLAASCGLPVWIRTPLVGGFNAAPEHIQGFLDVYLSMDTTNCSFELLRYHEYGRDKWARCGMTYTIRDGAVSEELAEQFEDAYRQAGLRVIRT